MVAYGLIHEGDKLLRGFVYLARQSAFNDPGRGNDIEVRHHFHIRIAAGRIQHTDILTKLLDSAVDDGIYIRFKKRLRQSRPTERSAHRQMALFSSRYWKSCRNPSCHSSVPSWRRRREMASS